MTPATAPGRTVGAPLALQIMGLLAAGLIAVQAVTVALVLFLPPEPPKVYRLSEIAAALEGSSLQAGEGRALQRSERATPPGAGMEARFAERPHRILAELLGVAPDRVVFRMNRPLPFAAAAGGGPGGAVQGPGQPVVQLRSDGGAPRLRPDGGAPRPRPAGFGPPGERGAQMFVGRPGAGPFPGFGFGRIDADRPVIGEFTAALRQASGRWVVVEPSPEPFLNDWQRRLLVWFLGCMAVLAPVGYLFARRITAPLGAFAGAAERLGRDPTAPLIQLRGPAEIGAAARAFNDMQVRLKRYVQDRTATMAAISHDLRTPLARMRFKLEKAPPELKASLAADVCQMEQMLAAVLAFIREGAEARPRERLDLLSVVECAVDNAAAAGGDVELAAAEPLIVEADALGLERLFANLIDNAVKYGRTARVRVRAEGGEGVVEVLDQGPGLSESELERVFQPFYRSEPSRSRDTGGIGLGLAVARSIARAHGGEVGLSAAGEGGLTARVRLPLAPA
ncbi:MAG TPA: ATP-binding protein [Caulobacteraceae bacterium]|jgi:signal transduction histidine kinase|nr:ATP-binding protein [Caulobacteraceae bacterium]